MVYINKHARARTRLIERKEKDESNQERTDRARDSPHMIVR